MRGIWLAPLSAVPDVDHRPDAFLRARPSQNERRVAPFTTS
jgi:hypothetical protein